MKVYLAGFDVFKPNAASVFASLCSEAVRLQLIPLAPIDGDLPPAVKGVQLADIFSPRTWRSCRRPTA